MRINREKGHDDLRREVIEAAESIAGLARNRSECLGYLIPFVRDLEAKIIAFSTSESWCESCPRCSGRPCAALESLPGPKRDA